jgi:hypothetical protein
MQENIELEYRVEIPSGLFKETLDTFQKQYELESHTKRLSYMGFWSSPEKQFDARVRITNGESEVVLKIGDLDSHDRTELSQTISKDQISGFMRMFSRIASENYIAERETYNFRTPDNVVISLVTAGTVCYIEYELLSQAENVEANNLTLKKLIENHGFTPLDKAGFKALNQKLDEADWSFTDTQDQVKRFADILSSY